MKQYIDLYTNILTYKSIYVNPFFYTAKILGMIKIKLRELMWEKNISAVHIQKETGINAATISRIINKKHNNLSLDTIDKLCNVLNCKIQDLLIYEHINK